jgi:hypothetical protein
MEGGEMATVACPNCGGPIDAAALWSAGSVVCEDCGRRVGKAHAIAAPPQAPTSPSPGKQAARVKDRRFGALSFVGGACVILGLLAAALGLCELLGVLFSQSDGRLAIAAYALLAIWGGLCTMAGGEFLRLSIDVAKDIRAIRQRREE